MMFFFIYSFTQDTLIEHQLCILDADSYVESGLDEGENENMESRQKAAGLLYSPRERWKGLYEIGSNEKD